MDFQNLIPANKDELKVLFQVKEDAKVYFYLKELERLLETVYPTISWDKETKEICLEEYGVIKGENILYLLSEYLWEHAGEEYIPAKVHRELLEMIFE